MRKIHWLKKWAKKGQSIPFAADDPNRPKQAAIVHVPRADKNLARARNFLQKGRTAEGLAALDEMTETASGPARKMQLAALVGDHAFDSGKFDEAVAAYQSAAVQAGDDSRAWVRPALAQVRALLKAAQVDDAYAVAVATWNQSAAQHEETQRLLAIQQADLQQSGFIVVKKRPFRASVVATRLGHLFLQEGEPAIAKEMFNHALSVNPQGGSRARQGLAQIALAEGDPVTAERRAREALLLGKFQAKTICVWPLLLAARRQQNLPPTDVELLAGIKHVKSSTVRARTMLVICKELRRNNDPTLETTANTWLTAEGASHPIIAAELKKMLNAKARQQGDTSTSAALTTSLLAAPQFLSPKEFIATAKLQFAASAQNNAQLATWSALGVARFGPKFQAKLRHTLAKACMSSNRSALAQQLLKQNVAALAPNQSLWGKGLWSLAKLAVTEERYADAANFYQQYFTQTQGPDRFKLYALMAWLQAASKSNGITPDAEPLLQQALTQTTDYELLLDVAHQLLSLNQIDSGLRDAFREKGELAAQDLIRTSTLPEVVVRALYKLAKRQNDFGDYPATIRLWETLTPIRRAWLWTPSLDYWSYIAFIIRAYGWSRRGSEAEALAQQYLQDVATTPQGTGLLGVTLGNVRRYLGNLTGALEIYDATVEANPTDPHAGYAFYWQALRAWKRGDTTSANALATRIQHAIAEPLSSLAWKRSLQIQASLLTVNLDQTIVRTKQPNFTFNEVAEEGAQITSDLSQFN